MKIVDYGSPGEILVVEVRCPRAEHVLRNHRYRPAKARVFLQDMAEIFPVREKVQVLVPGIPARCNPIVAAVPEGGPAVIEKEPARPAEDPGELLRELPPARAVEARADPAEIFGIGIPRSPRPFRAPGFPRDR